MRNRAPNDIECQQPEAGPLAELTREEFFEFISYLGWLTFRSIPASVFARHQHPYNTIADYLDLSSSDRPPLALAKEYVKDLASRKLNTEELCLKWFGETPLAIQGQVCEYIERGKPKEDR